MNIKEADKAQQIAQELTSKLIQSNLQIELGSMNSLNMLDNSQLFSSSVQAVTKLKKEDVNVIISRTDFEEMDKLVAFVKAQKFKNW
jgi:ABC-type branched-subunit amino acid transport system substrate-binding protein